MAQRKWIRKTARAGIVLLAIAYLGPMFLPTGLLRDRLAATVGRATGRQLTINGGLSVWLLPRPGASVERVSLSNAPWAGDPPLAFINRIELWPSFWPLLHGRIELDEIDIDSPEIGLQTNEQGQGNWIFQKPAAPPAASAATTLPEPAGAPSPGAPTEAPAAAAPEQPPSKRVPYTAIIPKIVSVVNGRVTFLDSATHRSDLDDHISLDFVMPLPGGALALNGMMELDGQPVRFALSVTNLDDFLTGPGSVLTAKITGSPGQFDLQGRAGLAAGPEGDFTVGLHLPPPGGSASLNRMGEVSLSGHAKFGHGRFNFDELKLSSAAMPVTINGKFSVDTSRSPVEIDGSIDFSRVDLGPYLSAPAETTDGAAVMAVPADFPAQPEARTPARPWRENPLKLSHLKDFDIDLAVTGGPITLGQTEIGRTAFRISAKDGRVSATLDDTAGGTGRLSARVKIDVSSPDTTTASLELHANQVPGDAILALRHGTLRGGIISVDGRLASQGNSERDMIEALQGQLHLAVDKGSIYLVNVNQRLRGALAGCPASLENAKLTATATVKNGLVTIAGFVLRAPHLDLSATGSIDLPQRRTDIRIAGGPPSCLPRTVIEGPWNDTVVRPGPG